MESWEIREKRYKRRGIEDFKLRNSEDLAEILDIYINEVTGYSSLSENDKIKFSNFLINFYNSWGLKARTNIFPAKVFIAKEHRYVVAHEELEDCVKEIGYKLVDITDKNNIVNVIDEKYDLEKYKAEQVSIEESDEYMRFEYIRKFKDTDNSMEWLHVITEKEFY